MFKYQSGSECLLYDFNLQVGDTLPQLCMSWETNIKVTAIDSIFTPYGYRKRFKLSKSKPYLYEGIGNTAGLVEPIGPVMECGYTLQCFSLNDIAYVPTVGASCDLRVGIDSYESDVAPSVFPNPFNDFATISFNAILTKAHLNLYNYIGEKVMTREEIFGESTTIEKGSLKSGVYFFEIIQDSEKMATGKLIITD
ncbi:T9SS type A sorting domain-containing protein [Aurantibacillus circumpalustris]|uniref:T9SS type A sorting domain-containing protein n=1 Tax=Aurantibacillus circumpalustris TaxID=3036359 RepID=UPI00295C1E77|nr:T9SS type A sorting domain-containing protein [Aurantibacillus circumpalustris]